VKEEPKVEKKEIVEPPKPLSRIFVGRLTRNLTKDHVVEIFSTYGTIKNCEMPCDPVHTQFHKVN
jgi:RNA-binding protein with serine-rich domain 1